MLEEPLPEVTWNPREPETRAEHSPRGVLHDLARVTRWQAASEPVRLTGSVPAKA